MKNVCIVFLLLCIAVATAIDYYGRPRTHPRCPPVRRVPLRVCARRGVPNQCSLRGSHRRGLIRGRQRQCRRGQICCPTSCGGTICVGCRLVNCLINPCTRARCPQIRRARCRPDYCGGCYARFYLGRRDVTHLCHSARVVIRK